LDTERKKDIADRAKELHELSMDFSLSHAVLATANMIEAKEGLSSIDSSEEEFLKGFDGDYTDPKLKLAADKRKKEQKGKVYISVGNLRSESAMDGARTFVYNRSALPYPYDDINLLLRAYRGELSISEHFEILLPPETDGERSLKYKSKKPSKKTYRFLIGHELGHLWLHLDEVRENAYKGTGTKSLPPELEEEANHFSFELSEHRDTRLLKIADYIRRNKN
jgi:hypothetical protein